SWVSAAIVAGALCLEPLARLAGGQLMPPAPLRTVEVTSGTVVGALFVYAALGSRRASRLSPQSKCLRAPLGSSPPLAVPFRAFHTGWMRRRSSTGILVLCL